MSSPVKILSTKKLDDYLHELAKENNLHIDEVEVIKTEPIQQVDFAKPQILANQNLLFTSYSAVSALSSILKEIDLKGKDVYCVGGRTARFFAERDANVYRASNALILSSILKKKKPSTLLFFKGNLTLNIIESSLSSFPVEIETHEVYKTSLLFPKVEDLRAYRYVWFFSPSGVESLLEKNELSDRNQCVSIGATTGKALIKYSSLISNSPSAKTMLKTTIKHNQKYGIH